MRPAENTRIRFKISDFLKKPKFLENHHTQMFFIYLMLSETMTQHVNEYLEIFVNTNREGSSIELAMDNTDV